MQRRRSGTTTQQMINCPHGSIYLWPNNKLYYPERLARDLGRDDIKIYSYNRFVRDTMNQRTPHAIIIDHACFEMGLV